jgi:hypothetical protein
MADLDDDELLEALGVEVAPLKAPSRTPREERIIAGFEDILRFHQTHGRTPQHGEGRDIFERLYAVRLEQLRQLPEAQTLLAELDTPGLLTGAAAASPQTEDMDEDALLAALGLGDAPSDPKDITVLRHVRSTAQRRMAEEVADRTPCPDFEKFQPLFEQVERELKADIRKTLRFGRDTSVASGHYFIVGGQLAYVAEVGEEAGAVIVRQRVAQARMEAVQALEPRRLRQESGPVLHAGRLHWMACAVCARRMPTRLQPGRAGSRYRAAHEETAQPVHPRPFQGQQAGLAEQTLCHLRPRDELAAGVGEELGGGEILLRGMPGSAPGGHVAVAYPTSRACSRS